MDADQPMTETQLRRIRNYLRFLARLHLDPRLRPKVDPSDMVQLTMLAVRKRCGCCKPTGATGYTCTRTCAPSSKYKR